ncbi:MAG: hypothetical protein KDC83_11030 [Flavobacteriales bacterium]|nr:hypothetical protein [Flavobacteriales bacterium]
MNAPFLKYLAIAFFILVGFKPRAGEHPLHISVTQIDFRPSEKSLQFTVKIFADDMEDALKKKFNYNKLPTNIDELLAQYINDKLQVKVNNKVAQPVWVGKELDEEAYFIYLELPKTSKVNTLEISNAILFDLYEDQTNIVHFSAGEIRKSEMFQSGDAWKSLVKE